MAGQYIVYKITSINGKQYIGYTSLSLNERLRHHIYRAAKGESAFHPFYNDIRQLGKESFRIEALRKTNNRIKAMDIEKAYIKDLPGDKSYNLSPGGLEDASFGGKIFWERLNNDPKGRATYLKKLSDIKKANDWSDYESMSASALNWRKENPKKAYRLTHRASRIARRKALKESDHKSTSIETQQTPKEKLMWRHKRSDKARENALKLWAGRTENEREEVGRKISIAQKERMKSIAIIPNFKQEEWPYAKATTLRKIKQGMNCKEIILDAIKNVKNRSSHWRDVKENLIKMGVNI